MALRDLFEACEKGDIARVRQAVADGIDARKAVDKNFFNYTPLHHACVYVPQNNWLNLYAYGVKLSPVLIKMRYGTSSQYIKSLSQCSMVNVMKISSG